MSSTAVILVVLLASVAISLGLAALIVRRGRVQADKALAAVGERERTVAATALGSSDEADGALRSTGTLVLTRDELAFAQWRPRRLLRIPRRSIRAVVPVKEHLGRKMRADVLQVTWDDDGTEQQVAFFIRDPGPWLADLGGTAGPG